MKKKTRTIKKPIGKPESFTKAQAKKAVKKVKAQKQGEKKYVLLEDIVIKAGTVFYESGETTFHDHYEMHMAFGSNHVGNFLVEKEMLEGTIYSVKKAEEIEFPFTELIE